MQAFLSEKIIGLCLEDISLKLLSDKLSEILAKNYNLDCLAIYLGNKESVRLTGLFINQSAFLSVFDSKNKTLKSITDNSEIFSGIKIQETLYENYFKIGSKELKIGNFYFNTFSKSIKNTCITLLYGGNDKKQKNRVRRNIENIFPFIEIATSSFYNKKNINADNFISSITSNLISNTLEIKGYMKVVLKLFQFYYNACYGSLNIDSGSGNYFEEIGKANNSSSVLDFNLAKNNFSIKLLLSSDTSMLNTSESHFLTDISLEYFSDIFNNFTNPKPVKDFRLSNIADLMKIFDTLNEGKVGLTDRLIDSAKFICKNIHLSDLDIENLSWTISLRNIGKVAVRFYFEHKSPGYENELNENIKSGLLTYLLPKKDLPLYSNILKASLFFLDITSKKEKIQKIYELINISDHDTSIKEALKDYVIFSKKKKCHDFYKCPEYITKSCSAYKSNVKCCETHHTMGDFKSIRSCKDCLLCISDK